jgi:uncharacterized protein (UPF0333 family)
MEGKMKNKKGQAMMEWLLTYGWAVLVVLVAIGALVYFGVFPDNFIPQPANNCGCANVSMDYVDATTVDNNMVYKCGHTISTIVETNGSFDIARYTQSALFVCVGNEMIPYDEYQVLRQGDIGHN